MPKILVNYTYNKKTDTYKLQNGDVVFADMPIALMDMGAEYDEILVVPINNRATVVDKETYLQKHKLFKLSADKNGVVTENQNGAPFWLPKDTDISQLRFINGQLVLMAEESLNENKEGE